jgi:lysophospholipase L1-like esterase
MKTTRIAALGDSIIKGVILNNQNRYSTADLSFMEIISSELDLRVDNYGKFGCTVNFGHSVIERHASEISESDYTFIEFGGNDCDFDWIKIADVPHGDHLARTPLETFTEELSLLVEKIRELGSVPVLISLPPILSDKFFSFFSRQMSEDQKENVKIWLGGDVGIISRWHESYNRALFQVANQTHTQIIDITTPFDTYRGDLSALYCHDGIHPNAYGHKLIAETIINMYL